VGLRKDLIKNLGAYCMNLKGRGGVKGSVRCIYNKLETHPFIARLDVKSFYGSISHDILLKQLECFNISDNDIAVINDYISTPDTNCTKKGIVAGGALSTLLGAVYLNPLDKAMDKLYRKGDIFYLRYVDDIIIMSKTRWKFKTALKKAYEILDALNLKVHTEEKRFIGKTSDGFDFLGYFFKENKKLKPSRKALSKFVQHSKRLLEQGGFKKLLLYVEHLFHIFMED